jgi:hypothetical protein
MNKWFGETTQEDIWQQLVNEINQENSGMTADVHDKGKVIKAKVGEWTVTLDTVTTMVMMGHMMIPVSYTRMRAPYLNQDGMRFKVYRASWDSKLGKFFGMQDIEVGDEEFDEEFIIQGTSKKKVRELLANAKIKALLSDQPELGMLEVKSDDGWFEKDFPEGVDELVFTAKGAMDNPAELKNLFVLFAEVLNQLCAIGSANKNSPPDNL